MTGALPFRVLDVFTERAYSGNPLAVVMQADGLSTDAMQRMAREFNLSETIFVSAPDGADHTASVRIFTPMNELPFAGHPIVGCAVMLAGDVQGDGDFAMDIRLAAPAGPVPVTVSRQGGAITATLTVPILPFAPDCPVPNATDAASVLGLTEQQAGFGVHRPGVFEGGPRFIYVPVRDLDALAAASPHEPAFSQLCERSGTNSVYVYTAEGDGYRARMFAPSVGMPEDPATGSASAILAAQLHACDVLQDGTTLLSLAQGIEMGRPSKIAVEINRTRGAITSVRVSGSAVRVSEGMIMPPPA